jgi:hypothetical protein
MGHAQDSLLGTKMSAAVDGDLDALHFKHLSDGYAEFVNCPDAAFALRAADGASPHHAVRRRQSAGA